MAINLANPVNWQSPLNRGLVARYMVIDGFGGKGGYYRNLARPRMLGTLTNGATWLGKRGPGNIGVLNLVGASSNYVLMGATDFPTSGDMTFACRMRMTVETGSMISFSNTGEPTKIIDWSIRPFGKQRFELFDGTNNPFVDGAFNLSNTGLHTIMAVRKAGSTLKVYVNGVEEGSVSDTASGSLDDGSQLWSIGLRRDTYGAYATMVGDDFCGWNRAFSADEVKLWHSEVRLGSPTTLTRSPAFSPLIFLPAAPSGGTVPVFVHHYRMQGAA